MRMLSKREPDVMLSLGCQLNSNHNPLKPNHLGTPGRDFLEVGRPTLSLDHTYWWWQPLYRRTLKKKIFLLPACTHSHWQGGYPVTEAFLHLCWNLLLQDSNTD